MMINVFGNFKWIGGIRSSHRRCSVRKSVLRNFTKFTGKYKCQSLFFNKVAGLRPATLLKKRLWYRCFPVIFMKFLRTRFLQNTSGRLLLLLNAIEIWINLEIIIVEIKKKIEWRNFLVSRDKNYYQFGQILRKLRKFIRIKKKKKMEGSSPGAEFFSGGNSPG